MTTITATQAADRAGVTIDTVRTWCRIGAIRAIKRFGRWIIDAASLARRIALGAKKATTTERKNTKVKATDIEITTEGNNIYLTAPYNPAANSDYKAVGGRWDSGRRCWKFDARDIERVRGVLATHFGYDDRPVEVVDARVDGSVFDGRDQEWWFGSRKVAERRYRDDDVTLADGVILLEGRFYGSGGSVKNPRIDTEDVVLEIRDVPAGHEDLTQDGVTVMAAPVAEDAARAALETERSQLLARLAEIDAQLAQ